MPTIKLFKVKDGKKVQHGHIIIKDSLTRGELREINEKVNAEIEGEYRPGKNGKQILIIRPGASMIAQRQVMFDVITEIKFDGDLKSVQQATLDNEDWITDAELDELEKAVDTLTSRVKTNAAVKKK